MKRFKEEQERNELSRTEIQQTDQKESLKMLETNITDTHRPLITKLLKVNPI